MKKIGKLFFVLLFLLVVGTSCYTVPTTSIVQFEEGVYFEIEEGEEYALTIKENKEILGSIDFTSSDECVSVDRYGLIKGNYEGEAIITATYKEHSDSIKIKVLPCSNIEISISTEYDSYFVGDEFTLDIDVKPEKLTDEVSINIVEGIDLIENTGNLYKCISSGELEINATVRDIISNTLTIIIEDDFKEDPYLNVTESEFYQNYTPARSYMDAYYRSLHGLMSGDISDQDQAPTLSKYQPKENNVYLRNTDALYSADKNTYYIVDAYGNVVSKVFRGGAYITLEEVAAYVFAFNEIPANYSSSKSTRPTSSVWGKYLRVNNTKFSGSTTKYPYEPELPNISGCGGTYIYYEMDLGTTGTDCDPSYSAVLYNNGSRIERGAARIVYTRYEGSKELLDTNLRYLFYTYNHYNDFQEYLNYWGGWGEMFGNITGGGKISSKYDYNPTPYVETLKVSFKTLNQEGNIALLNNCYYDQLFNMLY